MDTDITFGKWVKRRRQALGLTQAELGRRAGYSAESIRKVEADGRRPSFEMARLLATALEVAEGDRAAFIRFARDQAGEEMALPAGTLKSVPRSEGRLTNLPIPPTPLIGRAREVAAVQRLLRDGDIRLVTLTGSGGTGKTRVALQAAAEMLADFPDGVTFVNLGSISDPRLVISTIAKTLGVREGPRTPMLDSLRGALSGRAILLLLDNFEQVLDAANDVASLMTAPRLKILVTSRERLHLEGEHIIPIPPLAVPADQPPAPQSHATEVDHVAAITQYAAVQLFAERAAALQPDFAVTDNNASAVAEICRHLDGIPLAIELAAARINVLAPQSMLARLQGSLTLLSDGDRDLPPRQRTLRATMDWSHNLLTEGERILFRRFAVFVGGSALEAIEGVCNTAGDLGIEPLDGVFGLVDKSLLTRRSGPSEDVRFVMLETIHEYAQERLTASGELATMRQAHAAYFLAWIEDVTQKLYGPGEEDWFTRIEAEHDNLRAALAWANEARNESAALRLAAAMRRFWYVRGYWSEGRRWIESILTWSTAGPPHARAGALFGLGNLLAMLGVPANAQPYLEQALQLYRSMGDKRSISNVLQHLGHAALALGDYARAEAFLEESIHLAREVGDLALLAMSLSQLGMLVGMRGDYTRAESLLLDSLAVGRNAGSHRDTSVALATLGFLAIRQTKDQEASEWLRAATIEARIVDEPWMNVALLDGFAALAVREAPERAARLLGGSQALMDALAGARLPLVQAVHDATMSQARAALGDERLNQLMQEAQTLAPEQALADALDGMLGDA